MSRYNTKVKRPIDAFPKCPSCLYEFWLKKRGIHVYCNYCDWNSVIPWVEAGGVDQQSDVERRAERTEKKRACYEYGTNIVPSLSLRLLPPKRRNRTMVTSAALAMG